MAMTRSSSVSIRLSTNIQKKGCALPGRGREYCRTRWNWNRYHPGGHRAHLALPGAGAWAQGREEWELRKDPFRVAGLGPRHPLLPRIVLSP